MKPCFYDLHIHTCLSPCGDEQMTPPNIAGFAALAGLQMIAICDHNTARNARAVQRAAAVLAPGLLVIPGIELTCAEEFHIVCLFPSVEAAEDASDEVYAVLPPILNREDVFGRQVIMDEEERELGKIDRLLINAASISVDRVPDFVGRYGGFCFPAHIDRSSESILSALGEIPDHLGFYTAEVADPARFFAGGQNQSYRDRYHILHSSDAHRLESLLSPPDALHLSECSFEALKESLTHPPRR